MEIKEVINFMKSVSKGSLTALTIKEVEIQLRKLSNCSFKESDGELLMECILKYIDCIINAASNQSFREQIRICKKRFNVIQDIVSKEVQSSFVRLVTEKVFNIIIEDDIQSWCIKKELLKAYINCIRNSDKGVRQKTVQELPDMYLLKLVDSISTYGDYDLQLTIIETVFRMYGKNTIQAKLQDLIPESQELCEDFAEINADTFDEDARKFLNSLNNMSGKVFSMICKNVSLGNASCRAPMDGIEGLWVDFNMSERAITWYCNKMTFNANDSEGGNSFEENEDRTWDLITVFASDVENIQIYRPPTSEDILIYLKLKQPCISSCKDNREVVRTANDLKLVVSRSSRKTPTLLSRVLPHLFKNKFYRQSAKVSSSKKSTYKPLRVSVSKKTSTCPQKCKSDTSSFLSFIDPTAVGRSYSDINTSSRDDSSIKRVVSVSSASTKCEVISIGESSSVDTDTSLELVPLRNRPLNNQNSQYETAPLCLDDTPRESNVKISRNIPAFTQSNQSKAEVQKISTSSSQSKEKVSKNANSAQVRHADAEITETPANTSSVFGISLDEELRSVQEDINQIQILSGRCSGSDSIKYSQLAKSSVRRTCSTPLRNLDDEEDVGKMQRDPIAKDDKPQTSSSEKFHTADDFIQNVGEVFVSRDNQQMSQESSEEFHSMKVNIFRDEAPEVPSSGEVLSQQSAQVSVASMKVSKSACATMKQKGTKKSGRKPKEGNLEQPEETLDEETLQKNTAEDVNTKINTPESSVPAKTHEPVLEIGVKENLAAQSSDTVSQKSAAPLEFNEPQYPEDIGLGEAARAPTKQGETENRGVTAKESKLEQPEEALVVENVETQQKDPVDAEDKVLAENVIRKQRKSTSAPSVPVKKTKAALRKGPKGRKGRARKKNNNRQLEIEGKENVADQNLEVSRELAAPVELNEPLHPERISPEAPVVADSNKEKENDTVMTTKEISLNKLQETNPHDEPEEYIITSEANAHTVTKQAEEEHIEEAGGEKEDIADEIVSAPTEFTDSNILSHQVPLLEQSKSKVDFPDQNVHNQENLQSPNNVDSAARINEKEVAEGTEDKPENYREFRDEGTTSKSFFDQTLSTTLGTRRRRKLYDPGDLSHLGNVITVEREVADSISKIDPPAVVPKTIGTNRSSARKKDVPKKRTKFEGASGKTKRRSKTLETVRPRRLEVVNPHATLTTMDDMETRRYSHLRPVFHEMVESFRKEAGLSFRSIIETNLARQKELERQKEKEKRIARRYTKSATRRKVPRMRTEVEGNSDSSDMSFNLGREAEGRDEPMYSSPVAEYSAAGPPTLNRGRKKINIISDIQIRPKRASLADDAGIQRKKLKYQDIEAVSSYSQETVRIHGDARDMSRDQDVEDYREISRLTKRQLSILPEEEQSYRRIATGSAQYKKNSGDHKVLKYAYAMFKSFLDSLEVDNDVHHDVEMICNILEKYK